MKKMLLLICFLGLVASPAPAHFHMLLPDRHAVKRGETVGFVYQFGHPFEHELAITQKPTALFVVGPDGAKTDLLPMLAEESREGEPGKKVRMFTFSFTPQKRGDHTLVAISPELPGEGKEPPTRAVTKVVLHVQTQNGWDNRALTEGANAVELSPLTRPYGLLPGVAFLAEADEPAQSAGDRKPLAGLEMEVERYNSKPPAELPADEHVTGTGRTTRAGAALANLTEAGWWGVTASRERDKVLHRCTLWVYVEAQAAAAGK